MDIKSELFSDMPHSIDAHQYVMRALRERRDVRFVMETNTLCITVDRDSGEMLVESLLGPDADGRRDDPIRVPIDDYVKFAMRMLGQSSRQ
jgi:hypothetical protein